VLLDLASAQRLADQGQLQEAAQCCERNLSQHGPSAETYYLLGVIRDAEGSDRAAECYRRAVYLDPNHVEALTHLALLSDTEGDSTAAQRLRLRAQRAGARVEHKKIVAP
jgi:chemotaxis protein methyltransferase WspC